MVEEKLLKLGAEQAQEEISAGRMPAWLKPMVNASTTKAIREREASLVIQNSVRNAIASGSFATARGHRVRKTRKSRRGGIAETRSATKRRLKRMGLNSASSK